MPKFSITIPAYKKQYLAECINSILFQTISDFEIVIVNDASPEDLDVVVSEFSDSRIRYYKNEKNFGAIDVVDNWNKCLEYAKGEYIICLGDDDVLLPCCLEEYSRLIDKYPGLGVYHAWTEIIDENSQYVNITAARCEYESVYSLIWHRWDNRKQQFIGDFLFETKLLRENGGFYKLPLAWSSDDITSVIAAKSKGIANTQRLCFCYRINSQNISNTGNVSIKLESIRREEEWYNSFLNKEPESELDIKYWKCIKTMQPRFFEKKRALTIAKDIRNHSLFRVFYWLYRMKKYELTFKSIAYSTVLSLKG